MTTRQALDTFNGAELMSRNIPLRKLQMAVRALMSAAKRCMRYEEQIDKDELVKVIRCKDCIHYDFGVCLKIYSDGAVSQYAWQARKEDDYCSYGERGSADGK